MTERTMDDGGRRTRGWRIAVWSVAALMLLAPLVAMRFTDEVNWDETDFIVFGAMLAAACGTFELAARRTGDLSHLAAVAVAVGAAFLLVWINLAVGIIGSEDHPANLLFVGVLATGVVGALLVRARPGGMARVMAATASAQALVGAVAVAAGWGAAGPIWPREILALTGFFTAAWLLSGWLFRRAAAKTR